jgi:hypothetical protein
MLILIEWDELTAGPSEWTTYQDQFQATWETWLLFIICMLFLHLSFFLTYYLHNKIMS